MKRRNINIIPVVILIALAIFLYVNNKTSNKENVKAPSATASASQSPAPVNTPFGTVTPQVSPSAAPQAENYKTETISDFNITVSIPDQWVKKPQYDNRFEGSSGFAEFTAMSGYGLLLKDAADIQINNELKPLGDNPTITATTIASQEAVKLMPAGNDPKAQCAILAKFPKAITISGTPYYYLLVWTDRDHLDKISNGIKFIK
jgi:hypothetical protein